MHRVLHPTKLAAIGADRPQLFAAALILQTAARCPGVTALRLLGNAWAVSSACKLALRQCCHVRALSVQQLNTKGDMLGCLDAISALSQLTSLALTGVVSPEDTMQSMIDSVPVTEAQRTHLTLRLPHLAALASPCLPSAAASQLPALRHVTLVAHAGMPCYASLPRAVCQELRSITATSEAGVSKALKALPRCGTRLQALRLHSEGSCDGSHSNAGVGFEAAYVSAFTAPAPLSQLRRAAPALCGLRLLELSMHKELIQAQHAAAFVVALAPLAQLQCLLLPGIACKPDKKRPRSAGHDSGKAPTPSQFECIVAEGRWHSAVSPAPAMRRLCQALNDLPSLQQLALVQPQVLRCERYLTQLRADLEVFSITAAAVHRGQRPGGWAEGLDIELPQAASMPL